MEVIQRIFIQKKGSMCNIALVKFLIEGGYTPSVDPFKQAKEALVTMDGDKWEQLDVKKFKKEWRLL